jgi:hypothetical protein
MRRPAAINTKLEEDLSESFSNKANSGYAYLDDTGSPYRSYKNSHLSDSDSFSDSSKKIRKKRNAYQKISDDVRVRLLDAVQNGETLKGAAKRYKINYSSAKSILHTYRKEGRILKKSAQERTLKKKIVTVSEAEPPSKIAKSAKKENAHPPQKHIKTSQSVPSSIEKIKPETPNHGSQDEKGILASRGDLNSNFTNLLKVEHYEHHPTEIISHPTLQKGEDPVVRTLNFEDLPEMNHINGMESLAPNRVAYKEESSHHRLKYFDNFHMNYAEPLLHEPVLDHMMGEGHDYANYRLFSREFDPFHEMTHFPLQGRQSHNEELYPETSASLGVRNLYTYNPLEDRTKRIENMMNFEEIGENANCPFKSFMDTQKLFREALRQANLSNGTENAIGYRKGSMDFF